MLLRLRLLVPALAVVLAFSATASAQDANDRPLGMPAVDTPMEPMPTYRAPMGGGYGHQPPPMPPYAWPSYAPYNNYSRVAYPQTYPCHAFPHIGPFHPYPKAPLGWRHVKLSFDDGHWYLSSHAGFREWWTIRYW